MTKRLQPIRLDAYKPLREVVSETLRQAIQDGVLKPGERLMEIPLAEELGVSRTPIREAIRKLELEGFVVMVPRRGTYVANISENKNMESVVTADVEFHEVLYRASRNERLADIVHNLREQTYRFRSFSMNQPGRLRKTWEEHRQLVEAIASHNATQARKLARIHMEHSEQTLLQGMEESPEFTKA
ncbi:MAG: GntR family transcriptional regulator [Veillonella sp.]|nr:GntR family transcriptional regulator [Veillonella sp.]